ncbi:peptide ABC transporter substrate-binding protein [Novispirillum sp. DQ9]|uniref:peptide ABC transporter substrate-binding protein n=1 Tax=Novispirillum sp. DQ9 TaxID=3398612 RepID=UPI003C7CF1E3
MVMLRLLLLALLALSMPAQAQAPKTLTIGITQFPHTLHPTIDSMAATSYIMGLARRPITAYDADWTLVCLLCTELPTLDNGRAEIVEVPKDVGDGSGRGIAVTYTLPDKAAWGDGTPITTDDVVFTWEVGRHPQVGIAAAELYRRILDIKVTDAKTFTLVLDRVGFTYNSIGDFGLLPAHVEGPAFRDDPAAYRAKTAYDRAPSTPGLWFGPYRVAEVAQGAQVVLERNPAWWGKPPAFDRIIVKAVENTAALEANLLSGGVDMIAGELGIAVDQAIAFERRHGARYAISYKPSLYYEHLEVPTDQPMFADPRVRRALVQAIDRQAIVDTLFGGKLTVATTKVSPLDWVHHDTLKPLPFDAEAAGRLLDEAGWTRGADGIRRNAGGQALSFPLQTTAGNRTRERVQQVIQAQWRAVGIDAQIRNEPARVLFGETMNKRRFTGAVLFAWISSPENVPRTTQHCAEIPTEANAWTGQNYGAYCDPETDRLIDAIEVELDRTKREALWHRLQEKMAADVPDLPLFFRAEPYILPIWLKGLRPTGHLNPSTLWVEDWTAEGR